MCKRYTVFSNIAKVLCRLLKNFKQLILFYISSRPEAGSLLMNLKDGWIYKAAGGDWAAEKVPAWSFTPFITESSLRHNST